MPISKNNSFKGSLLFACVSLVIAVGIGALGAHALKGVIETTKIQSLQTGLRYQFYHSFALLIIPFLASYIPEKYLRASSWLLRIGIVFFSGSIYLLSTIQITQIESFKMLGPITPIGGLCFMAAWLILVLGLLKK